MYCWWFANLFNVLNCVRKLGQIKKQGLYYKKLVSDAPEKKDLFNEKFQQLRNDRNVAIRGILKSGADFLTSSKGTGKLLL